MKRVLLSSLIVCAVAVSYNAVGQSARTVLVQHFTQASCGPCATQNPTLEATLNANASNTVAIKHQVSWPGFDPMYNAYPDGPDDIRSYYGVTGVPNSVLDGTSGPGAPNTIVTSSTISSRAAIPSPFNIGLAAYIDPVTHTLNVTMDISCTQAVSGNLRAYIAVVEKSLTSVEEPGGTNGETDFYNVLRQYLPGTNGTTLASSYTNGQTESINESWNFSNGRVSEYCDLAIVAFIQDNSSKEVHQAAKVDVSLSSAGALDGGLESFLNVPVAICEGNYGPELKLTNWGSSDMTSASIDYNINGGTDQNYTWTGNLASCAQTTITLPEYAFTVTPTNTLNADILTINGGTDINNANDVANEEIDQAPETGTQIITRIRTDNYGVETTWELTTSSGSVVASGGPYGNNTLYEETHNLPNNSCYEFSIFDAYGDGICCDFGNGYYEVESGGNVIMSGGAFATEEHNPFLTSAVVGIAENEIETSLSIYPNPTNDNANVNFTLSESQDVTIEVYNVVGSVVMNLGLEKVQAGNHTETIDFSNLNAGLYYINIVAGNMTATRKLTVNK